MTDDEIFIVKTYQLAQSAQEKGNHPFGALLVVDGEIVLTAENSVVSDNDITRHAELNLVSNASQALDPATLAGSTLYTSTAPCLLCTAVILAAMIGKIVYSVSYEGFARLIPGGYRYIPCKEIVERLGSATKVHGPILEEEGLTVFQYWEAKFTPLEEILKRAGHI